MIHMLNIYANYCIYIKTENTTFPFLKLATKRKTEKRGGQLFYGQINS